MSDPIFILASPYSFRTVLCAMLGQHPNLYDLPDINLLAREYPGGVLDASVALDGLLRAVGQLYGGEQTLESMEMARRWLYRRLSKPTGDIYRELIRTVGPLRLVDASAAYTDPEHPDILHRIGANFPQAHYIHLVRHPGSQCRSWMKDPGSISELHLLGLRDSDTGQFTVDPQFDWQRRNRMVLDFLDEIPPERWIRCRGEDIVDNPRDHLEKICRWLGISWSDSVFEAMLGTENSAYGRVGPYGAMWGRSREFLTSPAFRRQPAFKAPELWGILPWRTEGGRFTEEVIALAREFGYA